MPVNIQKQVAKRVHPSPGHVNAELKGAPPARVLSGGWRPPGQAACRNSDLPVSSAETFKLIWSPICEPQEEATPLGPASQREMQVSYFLCSIPSSLPTNQSTAIITQYLINVINIRLSKLDGERVQPMYSV